MSHIVAPAGSPLAFPVLSCERLEESLAFYTDVIGFIDCSRHSTARAVPGSSSWT